MSKIVQHKSKKNSKSTVRKQRELNDFVAHLIHNYSIADIAELNGISRQQQHNRINKQEKEAAK
jgi:predicted DNA-binding protein YlxM (UPF0122 family)